MPFSMLRNRDVVSLTLPLPLKGIVEPGGVRVLPLSASDLIAALGGTRGLPTRSTRALKVCCGYLLPKGAYGSDTY